MRGCVEENVQQGFSLLLSTTRGGAGCKNPNTYRFLLPLFLPPSSSIRPFGQILSSPCELMSSLLFFRPSRSVVRGKKSVVQHIRESERRKQKYALFALSVFLQLHTSTPAVYRPSAILSVFHFFISERKRPDLLCG